MNTRPDDIACLVWKAAFWGGIALAVGGERCRIKNGCRVLDGCIHLVGRVYLHVSRWEVHLSRWGGCTYLVRGVYLSRWGLYIFRWGGVSISLWGCIYLVEGLYLSC